MHVKLLLFGTSFKTEKNTIIKSSIITCKGRYKDKARATNECLKNRNIPFVDHNNFNVRAHINYGSLQLNSKGSKLVANNVFKCLEAFKPVGLNVILRGCKLAIKRK